MANTFAPNGFVPVRRQDGAAWTANATKYKILSSNNHTFFQGDPVILLSSGFIDVASAPQTASATANPIVGIFLGVYYLSKAFSRRIFTNQWPGTSDINANGDAVIVDDPSVIYRVWTGTGASSAAGGPMVQADIGAGIQWRYGTGNTSSGLSGAYVDFATLATSSNISSWMVTGLVLDPPGANGTDNTTAGNQCEVKLALGQFQAPLTVI